MDTSACDYGILFDHGRHARIGLPEAVFCEGKSSAAVLSLLEEHAGANVPPILFTRLAEEVFEAAPLRVRKNYSYHALSRTAFTRPLPCRRGDKVAVVSAGTADGGVAWEAARTLEYLGIGANIYEDKGVAGLWRLMSSLAELAAHDVIIVVAGLDAALASVMGGLSGRPMFAVPTSIGYGIARKGEAALSSMLTSCAPGIGVMNIDNGYGAACAAARVINLLAEKQDAQ